MEIDAWYLKSSNKWDEQIGQELIEDQLVLSALELFAELAEAGYEVLHQKQFLLQSCQF
jgi:hypothetical protein